MNHLLRKAAAATATLLVVHVGSANLLTAQSVITPIPLTLNGNRAMHVANRLTMGQTEALVTSLTGPTANALAWISSQLNPNFAAENADVAPLLAAIGVPAGPVNPGDGHTLDQLRDGMHVYGVLSDWQLAARMGYFWDRHFNTFGPGVAAYITAAYAVTPAEGQNLTARLEWIDYEYYRQHALGTFRDLLGHTTFSAAMMIYLDTVANSCNTGGPNENYGRELMELYSLGPTYVPTGVANYTASDLDIVSRICAGWRLSGDGYLNPFTAVFNPAFHCTFNQAIFGTSGVGTFQANTNTTLDQLLDHLCASAACQDFICRKLMTEFLGDGSDVTYPNVLTNMKGQWGTQGNIAAVLNSLFHSGEFLSGPTKWTRAKTPYESVVAHVRIWNGSFHSPGTGVLDPTRVPGLKNWTAAIGETLFSFQTPDGFALESNQQPGSSVLLETCKMFSDTYYSKAVVPPSAPPGTLPYSRGVNFPIAAWVTASLGASNNNPAAVATLFLNRAYGSKWTATDLTAVTQSLSVDVNGNAGPLNPANPNDYAARLGQGVMATMSMTTAFLR